MKPRLKRLLSIMLLISGVFGVSHAEVLDADRKISVKLDDGTDVVLYGAAGRVRNNKIKYYYLPPRLTISLTDDKRPEFLFMKFITDDQASDGGVSGGILHFLVKWGLTGDQEKELGKKIKNQHQGKLAGAATMYPSNEDGPSFTVVSATLSDGEMSSSIVSSGLASLVPGGKAAAAARLDSNGAQLLSRSFEENTAIADVTAVFNMAYQLQIPAAKGKVTIDWSKIERETETIDIDYTRERVAGATSENRCFIIWCKENLKSDYVYTYDEVRRDFSYLSEKKYINFEFSETYSDERVNTIREAFIDYFVSSMTITSAAAAPAARTGDNGGDEEEDLNVRQGAGYTYNVDKVRRSTQRGKQVFNMEYKLAVQYPFQVVGNMKSWYAEAVSDPNAVQSVILADPFYQRRDILIILGGDAKDMFEDHVDMVTVDVEKERGDQPIFRDAVTFHENYLEDSGNRATLTYARSDNSEADREGYRYAVKWSFRGNKEFIQDWEPGTWEGLTLSAPVESRTIELEGDLDELEDIDVTRITAQIRYPVLGDEEEKNIQLSVVAGEPLVKEKIFMDRNANGYAYRLIFNHKTMGRLALPWNFRRSDNYIYASIPEDLTSDIVDSILDGVVKAAQDAVESEVDEQLGKFNDLVDGE